MATETRENPEFRVLYFHIVKYKVLKSRTEIFKLWMVTVLLLPLIKISLKCDGFVSLYIAKSKIRLKKKRFRKNTFLKKVMVKHISNFYAN